MLGSNKDREKASNGWYRWSNFRKLGYPSQLVVPCLHNNRPGFLGCFVLLFFEHMFCSSVSCMQGQRHDCLSVYVTEWAYVEITGLNLGVSTPFSSCPRAGSDEMETEDHLAEVSFPSEPAVFLPRNSWKLGIPTSSEDGPCHGMATTSSDNLLALQHDGIPGSQSRNFFCVITFQVLNMQLFYAMRLCCPAPSWLVTHRSHSTADMGLGSQARPPLCS